MTSPERPDATAAASGASRRSALVVLVALAALLLAPLAGTTATAIPAPAPAPVAAEQQAPAQVGAARATRKKAGKVRRLTRAERAARARAAKAARARARAQAQLAASPAWTGGTVTYHDGLPAAWTWSLEQAVAQWNSSGVAVRFVRVADPARAQVRVSLADIGSHAGLATVGRTSGAFVRLSNAYQSRPGDAYDRVEVLGVLTHELGHVLGLDHTAAGCELMGTTMDIAGCGIYDWGRAEEYRCDLLGPAAAGAAARLYGGTPAARPRGLCAVGGVAAGA